MTKREYFGVGDVGMVLVALLQGAFFGIWPGLIIGIVLDVIGIHLIGSSSFTLTVMSASLGALLLAGFIVVTRVQEITQRNSAADASEAARLAGIAKGKADTLARLEREIYDGCRSAVIQFEYLPEWINQASNERDAAKRHFKAGAFSPFWGSVEAAYVELGQYNQSILTLVSLKQSHQRLEVEYRSAGGVDAVPTFPVQLNQVAAVGAAQPLLFGLDAITYEAQRNVVFAQIWEQRRTTAAVVQGFANLEAAVNQLATTIRASSASLAHALSQQGLANQQFHQDMRAANSRASQWQDEHLRLQREYSQRTEKAVHYLREQDKRNRAFTI